jgi:hypothetical protein
MDVANKYEGSYLLSKIVDVAKGEEIFPPDGDLSIEIKAVDETINTYDWSIKIGNRLSIRMVVASSPPLASSEVVSSSNNDSNSDKDAVSFATGMISTRMMPPKELYRLEVALSGILPATQFMYFDLNDESQQAITMEGPKGSVHFTRLN